MGYPKSVDPNIEQWLEAMFSLDHYPDANIDEIEKTLAGIEQETVVCYNVGQGSCAAGCNHNSDPVIYYDFGGGIGKNPYPPDLKFCHRQQPVILSHWHMDHWISAVRHTEILASPWIVPRQSQLGPRAIRLANDIDKKGKLLIWPICLSQLSRDICTIAKLKEHPNRNLSGLVVVAHVQLPSGRKKDVLIPGDAPYRRIPFNRPFINGLFDALIATHHGGWHCTGDTAHPCKCIANSRIAYSYGAGNSYGHPNSTAIQEHNNAGWNRCYFTCGGHIDLIRKCPFPSTTGTGHTLRPVQPCKNSCNVTMCRLMVKSP